jgi:hypothetical protein
MIDKKREIDAELKELKPDMETSAEAISQSVGEKAFRIEKQRELDEKRQSLKVDIKAIGEKLESEIEKIEQKKIGSGSSESEKTKTDLEKWLNQQKKLRKS